MFGRRSPKLTDCIESGTFIETYTVCEGHAQLEPISQIIPRKARYQLRRGLVVDEAWIDSIELSPLSNDIPMSRARHIYFPLRERGRKVIVGNLLVDA